MKIDQMTMEDIRSGLDTKKFTAKELVQSVYKKISEVEDQVEAYITLSEEEAYKKAEEIDTAIEQGEVLGPLAGIPIAIKDNICTEGIKTTCASKMLEDFIPPYDATVVKKLKDAGAIIIGKTNMDEFAMGSSTENSAFKVTKNPWRLDRVPGGSSGGSAAAVAAGMAFMALGSDTGGSIRQPAAFCGVVGLKPTYGLVSRYGLVAFASSLDQIGPITKSVKDCALTLDVIHGFDPKDGTTKSVKNATSYLNEIEKGIEGLRIAIPREFFPSTLDSQITNEIMESMFMLKGLGATIDEISLPITEEGLSAYYIISSAEASSNLGRFDGIKYGYRSDEYEDIEELVLNARTEGFGKETKRRIMLGTYTLTSGYYDAYYNRAQKVREKIKQQFNDIFKKYDLIISPTSPVLPFPIGEKIGNPLDMYLSDIYTISANLTGLPAISLPCGFCMEGLPIGLQIIGGPFSESKILRAAYALEQELGLGNGVAVIKEAKR
ncbi:Asp-tRNA(Asn)/Glu-tRNA(Gln) amidotransferase subunit GatA [Serpentinicella alkaliphila]|uniref:Glutamyl-tRNA(Gln) amidotransferase subunit A n=1 Tax=Serpentinicella alkaliphila TaxID=1734049 RepID=A0A4R2TJ22_9FIRM|nr:Asp-tRNA(Asn)/Glu-tRNA(Gln) amidotransferase subunit GatA [Serpentinicella alkaliphila]QUH25346.1 Asp-tRNA(Asn)/Glu-tRNA(Gln) amidotransferase subunit GatA [Serpentinicella alkaliphila]TCQ02367.1 aspartyl/glutamyl-tRNA(Asn/Gln) amidotransferase subunit A [Serpentinicella alkaliphila]